MCKEINCDFISLHCWFLKGEDAAPTGLVASLLGRKIWVKGTSAACQKQGVVELAWRGIQSILRMGLTQIYSILAQKAAQTVRAHLPRALINPQYSPTSLNPNLAMIAALRTGLEELCLCFFITKAWGDGLGTPTWHGDLGTSPVCWPGKWQVPLTQGQAALWSFAGRAQCITLL